MLEYTVIYTTCTASDHIHLARASSMGTPIVPFSVRGSMGGPPAHELIELGAWPEALKVAQWPRELVQVDFAECAMSIPSYMTLVPHP